MECTRAPDVFFFYLQIQQYHDYLYPLHKFHRKTNQRWLIIILSSDARRLQICFFSPDARPPRKGQEAACTWSAPAPAVATAGAGCATRTGPGTVWLRTGSDKKLPIYVQLSSYKLPIPLINLLFLPTIGGYNTDWTRDCMTTHWFG